MSRSSRAPLLMNLDRHAWALVLALCIPALVPAVLPGWFEGHDDLHIYRLVEYDLALRDGQVPPRWFPDVSAGYGNPHPIYYAPLFYMVAEAFHLAGLDVILALKAAIVLFCLLAAIFMFAYARVFWGPAGAMVAATAYSYAPYHMLDLYVRKAFSEFTVFVFLPALLLAFHNLCVRKTRWDLIAGALAMAAMSIAHTISNMLVPPLLGAYVVLLSLRHGGRGWQRWRWLGRAALAAVIGYALAGFFLVPAFLERAAINLTTYTQGYVNYHKHFVNPLQLLWWPWDFGMSVEGIKDRMSFRLGLCLIAGAALAVLWRSRLSLKAGLPGAHAAFFLGVTVVAVFMMLPISAVVWDLLPPLSFVQFPWRFLMLATLSMAFLCGAAFSAYARPGPAPPRKGALPRGEPWGAALAVCALFVIEAALGGTLGVNLRVPAERVGFEEKPYNNMIDRGPGAPFEPFDASFVRRHTLRWIDHLPAGVSFMGLNPSDLERPRAQVERGTAAISDIVSRSDRVTFRIEAGTEAIARVNVYRFPGWTARVDGQTVPLVEVQRQRRVLFFEVPPGRHDVEVVFERTFARVLGDALTLAGLAALALVGLWPQTAARRIIPPA